MSADGVHVERFGGVLVVRLDRPSKRNALNAEMLDALRSSLEQRHVDVRSVVVHGGEFFCAGADIAVYASGEAATAHRLTSAAAALIETLATVPVPVVAAVEGMALGGGLEVALACDMVVAGRGATVGLPEVALGLVPGWGGTQRLAAQVGSRRAKQMIMLQERLSADDAERLGLVNVVVDDGQALSTALTIGQRLADSSRTALAAVKDLVGRDELSLAYAAERDALREVFASPDGIEGVRAFTEKRPPVFGAKDRRAT